MPTIQLPIVASLDADGNKIINLGTPTGDADAATKAYVDGINSGLSTGLIRRQVSGTGYQVGDTVWNTVGIYTSRSSNNTDATTNTNSWTEIATFTHSSQVALITTNRNNIATLSNQVGPIADPFSETATYVEDTQVWFENKLYIANANINTAGAFVPAQWTVVGSGTGINTGLTLGTTSTTALAGNSTTDNIAEGVTNLYYTAARVNALITSRSITEYSPSAAYNGGEHLIVSTGTNRGLYEVLQAIQANSGIQITSTANFVKRTAFLTDAELAQIDTNESNLNTHAASRTNPHSVTGAQVGVGLRVATFTNLIGDATIIKTPGTTAIVTASEHFDVRSSIPVSSTVQAIVGDGSYPALAFNDGTGNYTLSFPQSPIGQPLSTGDTASFFITPDGGGFTKGQEGLLVEGVTVSSQIGDFAGQNIAAVLPLTEAQFNAIGDIDGVASQVVGSAEILGIPSNQLYAYEAATVPLHTISSAYFYAGDVQTTAASTSASDWIDQDIASNTRGGVGGGSNIDVSTLVTDTDVQQNAAGSITGFRVGTTVRTVIAGGSELITLTNPDGTTSTTAIEVVRLTNAELDALDAANTTQTNTLYITTDDSTSSGGGGGTLATFTPQFIGAGTGTQTVNSAYVQINNVGGTETVEVWLNFEIDTTGTGSSSPINVLLPATDTDGNTIPRPIGNSIGDGNLTGTTTSVHYTTINTSGNIIFNNGAQISRTYGNAGSGEVVAYLKYIATT